MTLWHPHQARLERKVGTGFKINAAPPAILAFSFLFLIVTGTLLLKLPFATEIDIGWEQALFTATSAVTVTGLSVVDTGTSFTIFGKSVIAILIQCGGFGLMTFAVVTLLSLGRKIGLLQRVVAKEAFNHTDTSTLLSVAKSVMIYSLVIEFIGFLILSLYWIKPLGWETGLFHAFFYTISAFNNAGFSLSPNNLMGYVSDPVVSLTISGLFILGGLGFTVWIDVTKNRSWSGLTPYSKAMILGTMIINVVALLAIYLIEHNNPHTLGPLSEGSKWLASWFQAVTPRTAGFNTLSIEHLEDATTAIMMLLMFIGGGSVSTASGIKVVTFIVLILATYSYLRRDKAITLFNREIARETVSKALALTMISVGATWMAMFALLLSEDAPFIDVVFEAVSAFGTVGLSRGLTSELSSIGEFIIIALMFIGRLGPLTLAYFLASPRSKKLRHPETRLTIG
ncbi:TrkH family potassium uptake protein [Paraferrimonas haliotis]|uniref:Ktr system potassium transporter B n=1 Tax=Paraferrimonas haliotis TaxID=2013866 RepID=A0AA37WW63_9GAMM|nr:TrkH family potassium uptake protein [Paraferrimonas haliotis]GLS83012.1 Ktr system potassium transporter B [Paraferrimonas haliotis]